VRLLDCGSEFCGNLDFLIGIPFGYQILILFQGGLILFPRTFLNLKQVTNESLKGPHFYPGWEISGEFFTWAGSAPTWAFRVITGLLIQSSRGHFTSTFTLLNFSGDIIWAIFSYSGARNPWIGIA